ncbi:DivIVA domain-containing protein [Leucobacter weissii]|uniref:Cell wall synthesis protein Wag31 n=1 Tax=Leucobacter weissii TaxID=1983706 RepID=A0A939MK15_9MICO|nr:DivIVA domain-containing protein [Leucobacter weissii]MBO1901996.1 DivIVA domain-containing protein [Leucobacter weissii]
MALTPEEVVNQKFTITKFRDGYDLDQVDDFLDTIVEDLRQHEQEKEALRAELESARERIKELEAQLESASQAPAQDASAVVETAAAEQTSVSEQTIVVDAPPAPSFQPAQPSHHDGVPEADAIKSSAMLQLALELHDKYIHEGEVERDRLVGEAEKTASKLVGEAQKQRADELQALSSERQSIRQRIQELREFESEYRDTLTSYIQAQLRELEGSPEPKGGRKALD